MAPDGEAREVSNTKPLGTMEDIRLYPKGQSPFDVGYFEGKGINPQPYIIDPNEKPKDMRQYLMADTSSELIKGVKGSAFLGASVTDDEKEEYPTEPSPSPMPGPPPVPEGHSDMDAYEEDLDEAQKEQKESTGGFAGGGGGRGGGGGSWPKDSKGQEILEKNMPEVINETRDTNINSDVVQINFTKPEFEQVLKEYQGNINALAKDMAPKILNEYEGYEKWSEEAIAAEIVMHYVLYKNNLFVDKTKICDIAKHHDRTKWIADVYASIFDKQISNAVDRFYK